MSKALLVASIVFAGVAVAASARAEPFARDRQREGGAGPSRAQAAEQRRDLWEARKHAYEQRRRQRERQRHAPPPGQNAGGPAPYGYGAPYGGGYYGDYVNPPPRQAPPPSPRGLHDGLWYY
ncbi:hypothetical protein [Methylosinus sp. LW4]|uniref:hypothetical protein n=1 Tax=Methylosinus sp. LW4 TaxID=136993 RepID=UPI00037E257F|nr:hypothetical protein [Methylosinus sp. LW4]